MSASASTCSHVKSSSRDFAIQNITILALVPSGSLDSVSRECSDGDMFVYPAMKMATEFINNRSSGVCRGRESRTLRVHVDIKAVETGVNYVAKQITLGLWCFA